MLARPDSRVAVVLRSLPLPRELVEARVAIDALEIPICELCAELIRLQEKPAERFTLPVEELQRRIDETNRQLQEISARQVQAQQAYRSQHAALVTVVLAPLRREAAEKILTATEDLHAAVTELQGAANVIHEAGGRASAPPCPTLHYDLIVATARDILEGKG